MRCFIAAQGSGDLGAALGPWLDRTRERFPELRVTPSENLHLTLAFLGELDEAGVDDARSATAAAAQRQGWTIAWASPGAFPSRKRPRVLWLGVGEGDGPLGEAQERLQGELVTRGLPADEKTYRPHLTLARVRHPPLTRDRAAEVMDWLGTVPEVPPLDVDSLVLFESKLGRPAAVHTPLLRVALG